MDHAPLEIAREAGNFYARVRCNRFNVTAFPVPKLHQEPGAANFLSALDKGMSKQHGISANRQVKHSFRPPAQRRLLIRGPKTRSSRSSGKYAVEKQISRPAR